jgi:hypothetical protein
LDQTVSKGRFAVVDVSNNREIADMCEVSHRVMRLW